MNNITENTESLQSSEYITKMQKEGLFDGMNNEEPQYPDCEIYMIAYFQAK